MSEQPKRSQEPEGVKGSYVPAGLECVECRRVDSTGALRWRAYRIDDPSENEPPALAFYCPVCAEREFGELGQSSEPRNMHW